MLKEDQRSVQLRDQFIYLFAIKKQIEIPRKAIYVFHEKEPRFLFKQTYIGESERGGL